MGGPAFIEWTNYIRYYPPNDCKYGFYYDELFPIYHYFSELWQEIRRSDPKALIPVPVVAYYRTHRHLAQMPRMGDIFQAKLEREGAFQHALNVGAC